MTPKTVADAVKLKYCKQLGLAQIPDSRAKSQYYSVEYEVYSLQEDIEKRLAKVVARRNCIEDFDALLDFHKAYPIVINEPVSAEEVVGVLDCIIDNTTRQIERLLLPSGQPQRSYEDFVTRQREEIRVLRMYRSNL